MTTPRSKFAFRPSVEVLDGRALPSVLAPPPVAPAATQVVASASKVNVTLTTDRVTRLYGQPVTLYATLKRADTGVLVLGAPVKFYIDNDYVGSATTTTGYTTLTLSPSAVAKYHVGTHRIRAEFGGNQYFHSQTAFNEYVVFQQTPTLVGANVSGRTQSTVTVTAALKDRSTAAPLANRWVEVTIDTRYFGRYKTDAAGNIRFSYRIPQPGAHRIEFAFAGDVDYKAAKGTSSVTGT